LAFDLKRAEYKPEHAVKLNFYLSVQKDQVRLPYEKPSIYIVLCREKKNVIVEDALQGIDKPMGMATYKPHDEMPEKYRNILPAAE